MGATGDFEKNGVDKAAAHFDFERFGAEIDESDIDSTLITRRGVTGEKGDPGAVKGGAGAENDLDVFRNIKIFDRFNHVVFSRF